MTPEEKRAFKDFIKSIVDEFEEEYGKIDEWGDDE